MSAPAIAFAFLATLWTPHGADVYVLDSALTGQDCIERMMDGASAATDNNGQPVDLTGATLSCEFDAATPAKD